MAPEPTESVSAPENNSTAPGDESTAMEEADRAVHAIGNAKSVDAHPTI